MAITINSVPPNYSTANDDLFFVVSSTNTSQTNFKYVFAVSIGGSVVATIKQFPDPSNLKGIFNAAAIVRNYLTTAFKPTTPASLFEHTGTDGLISYSIGFGEEYGGTEYPNLISGTWNAYNTAAELFPGNGTPILASFVSNWMTERDLGDIQCQFGEPLHVSWMNASGSSVNTTASVQVYNENGSPAGTAAISGSWPLNAFSLLDISPGAINQTIGAGTIPSTAFKYGVRLNYGSTSPEIMVRLVCSPKYTPVTLHFLNRLGGFDSFGFRLINKQSRDFTRNTYQRNVWQYDNGSTSMKMFDSYRRMNAGVITNASQMAVTYKLRSDMISAANFNWLRQLIASPEVYMFENGYYFPVIIRTSNWEQKIKYIDKMNVLELDVEYSRKLNGQFR